MTKMLIGLGVFFISAQGLAQRLTDNAGQISAREFVIRTHSKVPFSEIILPQGTVIASVHQPLNIITAFNESMDASKFLSALETNPQIDFISAAEYDRVGNPM